MKHLKLFFALFAMLALGVGNAWGEEVTFDFKTIAQISGTTGGISWETGKTGSATATACNSTNGLVLYGVTSGGGYFQTTSPTSGVITNVNIVASPKKNTPKYTIYGSTDGSTWTEIESNITISSNNTTKDHAITGSYTYFKIANTTAATAQLAITTLTITYETSGGETPDPTPSKLSTPANLKEASITETSATLSWDAVANASNYSVTINGNTETATTNSYSATGLTAGTEYTWSVVAKGDGTNYTDSEAAQHTFTTTAATTPDPEPGTGGEETWTLVTNASDLKAGDIIVIASNTKGFVASSTITSSYMEQVNSTFSTDKSTITTLPAEAAQLTIGGTSGAWTLTYDGKQLGATAVKKVAWDNGTKTWSITIANDGGATIQNGTSTYGRFLHNVNSTRFTTYASEANSSMLLPQIYKKVTSSGGGEPSTPTPSVTLDPSSKDFGTINVGETPSQEFTITTENTTATLTASVDNTTDYAVSDIAGNKVTVTYQPQSAGTHPAVLTVKAGEEATATVNLTGKAVQALEGTWILVTDASSLKAGDEIIIAAKEYDVALSTTQANNNRPEVAITKNGNTITATSETQVLTLQAGTEEGTLALYTGDGYLYAASSSSNYLRTENTLSENSSWTISIADGAATLTAQGTYERNTIFYNQSNKLFACYASTTTNQKAITLYKKTNGQQLAGLAYETTKYLTKLGETFATPVLANPNAVDVTYESSDNNVATVAADGAVTINAAGIATITASFAGNSSFLEGSAKYTICVTEHAGTEANPYTVADARRVIDVMGTATDVYATGIVSEIVTAYSSEHGDITYNISVDGQTTSDQLQAYRGKAKDGENFTSADDIKLGDEVVVKGNLKKYDTTYEFDADNQLVSLNRTKQQAGLAYAETEHTANVGEDFAEPALTNPNNLTVTYSSSNSTLATVNATTGDVTILAAGKVTITATTAGDATYAAGSTSYNITISDPSLAVAQLPFTYNSGKADIENTAGMTQEGLGSDYTSDNAQNSKLKFDHTGDYIIIHFDTKPDKLMYNIKNNSCSGGEFSVQESTDGETYSTICTYQDEFESAPNALHTLQATSRYVKFIYTEKGNGNVGLGNIKITKPDLRQEASLVWSPSAVTLTQGDAFTAPTLQNPKSVSGITYESSNDEVATVTAEGEIALASAIGTATITATFAGDATYKPATATCTITVNPKTETVVILAQYNGQWYALKNVEETADKVLAALPVNYVGGKLYNVEEADKATIEWQRAAVTDGIIFKNGENYISGTAGDTNLKLSTTECAWTLDGSTYKIGNRTFIYRAQANGFKNYNATTTPGTDDYSNLPVVTAPVYGTGTITPMENLTPQMYGTICLENNIVGYEGITFYKVAGKEGNKVIFDEVTELEAGMPYIYIADSETATIVIGEETEAEAGNHNSLQGTFTQIDPAESNILTGNYILYNNVIKKCGKYCGLKDHKAYFIATELESLGTAPAQMPGRRRVSMGMTGENGTTDLDNITTTDTPVKVIENGQLIIIRDGVKYNVQGQKL